MATAGDLKLKLGVEAGPLVKGVRRAQERLASLSDVGGKLRRALVSVEMSAMGASNSLHRLAAAVGALYTAQKAFDWAEQAAAIDTARGAFKSMGGTISDLRVATKGMISDAQLMKGANLAKMFGIDAAAYMKLAKSAQTASAITGDSFDFLLESAVRGTARLSPAILDNLGISFRLNDALKEYAKANGLVAESLTSTQQRMAIATYVSAHFEKELRKLEQAGVSIEDPFSRFKATVDNLADAAAQTLVPAFVKLIDKMTPLVDAARDALLLFGRLKKEYKELASTIVAGTLGFLGALGALAVLGGSFSILSVVFDGLAGALGLVTQAAHGLWRLAGFGWGAVAKSARMLGGALTFMGKAAVLPLRFMAQLVMYLNVFKVTAKSSTPLVYALGNALKTMGLFAVHPIRSLRLLAGAAKLATAPLWAMLLPLLKFIVIAAAIAAVMTTLRVAWEENWFGMRETVADVWAWIQDRLAAGWVWLAEWATLIGNIFRAIGMSLLTVVNYVTSGAVELVGAPIRAIARLADTVKLIIGKMITTIVPMLQDALHVLANAARAFPGVAAALGVDPDQLDAFAGKLSGLVRKGRRMELEIKVGGLEAEVEDVIQNFKSALAITPEGMEQGFAKLKELALEGAKILKEGGATAFETWKKGAALIAGDLGLDKLWEKLKGISLFDDEAAAAAAAVADDNKKAASEMSDAAKDAKAEFEDVMRRLGLLEDEQKAGLFGEFTRMAQEAAANMKVFDTALRLGVKTQAEVDAARALQTRTLSRDAALWANGAASLDEFNRRVAFAAKEAERLGITLGPEFNEGLVLPEMDLAGLITAPVGQAMDFLLAAFEAKAGEVERSRIVTDISNAIAEAIKGNLDVDLISKALSGVISSLGGGSAGLEGGIANVLSGLAPGGGAAAAASGSTAGAAGAAGAGAGAAGAAGAGAALGPAGMAIGLALGAALAVVADKVREGADAISEALQDGAQALVDTIVGIIPEDRLTSAFEAGVAPVIAAIPLIVAPALMLAAALTALLLAVAGAATFIGLIFGPIAIALAPVIIALGLFIAVSSALLLVLTGVAFILSGAWIPLAIAIAVVLTALLILFGALAAALTVVAAVLALFAGVIAAFSFALGQDREKIKTLDNKEVEIGRNRDRLFNAFAAIADRVAVALEPLLGNFMALAGVFNALISVVLPFMEALAGASSIGSVMFQVAKAIAVALGAFAVVVAIVGNTLIDIILAVMNSGVFEFFVNAIGGLAAGIAGVAAALVGLALKVDEFIPILGQDTRDALEAFQSTLSGFDSGTLSGIMDDAASALSEVRPPTADIVAAFEDLVALTEAKAIADANALADLKRSSSDMNEELLNVPDGFKVALERFRASTGATGPLREQGGILDATAPQGEALGQSGTYIENVTITGLDEATFEAISREARRQAAQQAGNPYGANWFNREGR